MERRIGVPKGRDATAFYEDLVDALEDISVAALDPAQRWFRDHWEAGYWPTVAKIRSVAFEAKTIDVPKLTRAEPEKRELSEEAIIRILTSDLGRQAARERWIGDLYDYVREHKTLSGDAFTIKRMAARGGVNDQLIRDLEADQVFNHKRGEVVSIPKPVRDELILLGRKMQDRDDKVSLEIGVTPPVHTTQEAG